MKAMPVGILTSYKWNHDLAGISYTKENMSNPEASVKNDQKIKRSLWNVYSGIAVGDQNPEPVPVVKGYGITTIAELFGCRILFTEDEGPYAEPLNISDKDLAVLRPITRFEAEPPIIQLLRNSEQLNRIYGKSKIAISYQGYLNTCLKIRGDRFLMDLILEPEKAIELLEIVYITTEALRSFIADVNESNGYPFTDQVYAPNCTVAMVSPEHYKQFIMPFDARMAKIYSPNFGIHHCGEHMELFAENYRAAGVGNYYDIGYNSNVAACVKEFTQKNVPNQIIRGRYSPARLLYASPKEVEREVRDILDCGVNYLVCIGIDPKTPVVNLERFYRTAEDYTLP